MSRWLNLRNGLLVLAAILFLIAWNRGIALLYGMFALVVAILVTGYAAPWWNLRGVTAGRTHAATGVEGEPFRLRLQIAAAGWLPRYMLRLSDRVPFAAQEETAPAAFVPRLRGACRVDLQVTSARRGAHRVGPLQVETAFPLGLHCRRRSLPGTESETLIYPAAFEIGHFPYLSATHVPTAGSDAASLAGGAQEFLGVREYRRGDSPRHIHWPSSARTGDLVVREFEFVNSADVCILLDQDASAVLGAGRDSTFEYAVKIAASIGAHALARGHRVQLLGYGAVPVSVPPGRGGGHRLCLLEALARCAPDGDVPYAEAIGRAARRIAQGAVIVLFEIVGAGEGPRPGLRPACGRRLRPVHVLFDGPSFRSPSARLEAGGRRLAAGAPYYHVRCGDALAAAFARP